jgi:cytochrome c oxidase cbb3-type subunit 4
MDLESAYQLLREFWVVWLMVLFLAIVFWVYRPKNKKRFEEAAEIPLKDDK